MIKSVDERRDLVILPGKKEAVDFALAHFVSCAEEAIDDHGFFKVALSGGSTPKALFEALSSEGNRGKVDWKRVKLFWSDERCVPPDHPDSNYRMAMESGLKGLAIPSGHIFRMRGEEHPEEAGREYDELLNRELQGGGFDLVMLGMGEDGHTASLFPKTHALHALGHLATANFLPEKGVWRLTLTYECINAARHIVLYVLGEGKAETVKRVLLGPDEPDTYPVQRVGTEEYKALWILDRSAALRL